MIGGGDIIKVAGFPGEYRVLRIFYNRTKQLCYEIISVSDYSLDEVDLYNREDYEAWRNMLKSKARRIVVEENTIEKVNR